MPKRTEIASAAAAAAAAAMSGTFTRSRSEVFLHRTRSGRARPDPKLRRPAPFPPPPSDQPRNSVKDLRLKRVFSVHEAKIEADKDRVDEKGSGSDEHGISAGEDSMETATPPDLDKGSGFDGGKGVRVSEEVKSGDSPPEKIVEISPFSRSKLIMNPTSISYRRLLPYLKDLAKDGSSGIEIVQSHHCLPKAEKTTTEKPASASEEQSHVVPFGDFPMANSGGNNDSNGNPVLENPIVNFDEIVYKAIKVVSPNSLSESKVPTPEVTCEVVFNENNMDELSRQEQEGPNNERDEINVEILKVSTDCIGDMVQSTPPDAGIASKVDDSELGSGRTISQPALNKTSKNSLGLVSCSRSKVYRNPSSFSYRRLLPYLMDLAKNSSSGLEIVDSQSCTTKVENSIEERPSMLNDVLSPRQQHHTVSLEDSSPVQSRESEDSEMHVVSQSPCLDSQKDAQNAVTTELPNSGHKSKVEFLCYTTEVPLERSDFEFGILSKSSYCSPATPEDLSFEEQSGSMLGLPHSPMEIDMGPNKKVSLFEAFGHANRGLAPRKGIMKRQSRRCKGICMCLDCVSFRVHAERAYEFSRRQMSDADEVVERLMNELSCLRNLMVTSIVPMVDGAGGCTVIQVCQEQLKGVCQGAYRVEEQAKSRMRQMFGDLNAHCRIPGSRVTFSDSIHDGDIP